MIRFSGTMTNAEGKTVDVIGAYSETDQGGIVGWTGWVQEKSGLMFRPGNNYTLTLRDGSKGLVRITGGHASSDGGNASAFKSQGPTPR